MWTTAERERETARQLVARLHRVSYGHITRGIGKTFNEGFSDASRAIWCLRGTTLGG